MKVQFSFPELNPEKNDVFTKILWMNLLDSGNWSTPGLMKASLLS
jgi:hypothetical protein